MHDGLVEGVQLSNEIQHNDEAKETEPLMYFPADQAVAVAVEGNGTTSFSRIQINGDLEELEVLSATTFLCFYLCAVTIFYCFYIGFAIVSNAKLWLLLQSYI